MCKKSIISKEEYETTLDSYFSTLKNSYGKKSRLNIYEQYHNMSFYDLVNEALYEQRERVPFDQLMIFDRLVNFRNEMINTKKYSTAMTYVTTIKTLYRVFRISIPPLPTPNRLQGTHTQAIGFDDIITLDEIKQALDLCSKEVKARCMTMITGGYNFDETQRMTIRKFIDDNYRHHQCEDDEEALLYLAQHDNCIWINKTTRGKTGKNYYGFTNPETTQEIAKYVLSSNYQERESLFNQTYVWVDTQMGKIDKQLGFRKVGDMKLFRCHMLRKYNATHLKGSYRDANKLSLAEVDELQGRGKTSVQDTYMKTDVWDLEYLYCRAMNNVSIYNTYDFEVVNDKIIVECTTNKKEEQLQNKLDDILNPTEGLKNLILELGEDNFMKQVSDIANSR